MQSRVWSITGLWFAGPSGFRGIAARRLTDQHQAGCAPCFCGQLQTATRSQREGLFWFCNDKTDGR